MEKKKTIEENMKELETMIASLENGEFGLDESIEVYAKAMKLVKECDSDLKKVEERVSKIVKETEEDFKLESEMKE
jgi:exodeoxyribonuclease VII small subunit